MIPSISPIDDSGKTFARRSGSPRTPNQVYKPELLSPNEPSDRSSRASKSQEYDRGKGDNGKQERSSRQREESIVSMDRPSNIGPLGVPETLKSEPSSRGRDEVQTSVAGGDQHRVLRVPSRTPTQGDDLAGSRPRTPEGPRANVDATRSKSPGQRAAAQRDAQPLRQSRYDSSRTANVNNPRSTQGFRAPPPTGPRSAAISGGLVTSTNLNISRPQHPGRPAGVEPPRAVGGFAGRLSAAITGKSESITSSNTPLPSGAISDRTLGRPTSNRDNHSDLSNPANASDARRSQNSQSDTIRRSERAQTSDALPGPTEGPGRQNRDLQDDDPRRLSRGPENLVEVSDSTSRRLRPTDDNTRLAASKASESTKELASITPRISRDNDEKDYSQVSRQSRESRSETEKIEVGDGRRTRTTVRTETGDRETSTRSRGITSMTGQSEGAKVSGTRDSRLAESGHTREGKEPASRDQKENVPLERKDLHKEKSELTSREPRDTASKEQRSARSHREDEGGRRREERDASSRIPRDDTRESRNDRARVSHNARELSRRSPSRTHSDRGDKKERDRDSERRNGSHREAENRDKERLSRESERRRDVRDRDRTSREKEGESRRGSRKHERDRSADAVDRGTRSGDDVDSSGVGESANKRRRMGR